MIRLEEEIISLVFLSRLRLERILSIEHIERDIEEGEVSFIEESIEESIVRLEKAKSLLHELYHV